jgi:hypothetical protein
VRAYRVSERGTKPVFRREDVDLSIYSSLYSILHLHISSARVITRRVDVQAHNKAIKKQFLDAVKFLKTAMEIERA